MDVVIGKDVSFGQLHFGSARLGDARRTRRLVKIADRIMEHPGGSTPQKMSNWAELIGLYRLMEAAGGRTAQGDENRLSNRADAV